MSNPTDPENAALSEPMVARLEIEQLGDAAREKQITDAVTALSGVKDVKVKDALFVTYDPLITTEKKIEAAVRSSRSTVKAAGTDTEGPHPRR